MTILTTAVLISVLLVEIGVLFCIIFVMPEGKEMMKNLKEWYKK